DTTLVRGPEIFRRGVRRGRQSQGGARPSARSRPGARGLHSLSCEVSGEDHLPVPRRPDLAAERSTRMTAHAEAHGAILLCTTPGMLSGRLSFPKALVRTCGTLHSFCVLLLLCVVVLVLVVSFLRP